MNAALGVRVPMWVALQIRVPFTLGATVKRGAILFVPHLRELPYLILVST